MFDIYLTGSICSLVGPAVIVIVFPDKGPLCKSDLINSIIFSGSTSLPGPTSPQACSPSSGPIKFIPLDTSVRKFSWVLLSSHIVVFIAGAMYEVAFEAKITDPIKSSALP